MKLALLSTMNDVEIMLFLKFCEIHNSTLNFGQQNSKFMMLSLPACYGTVLQFHECENLNSVTLLLVQFYIMLVFSSNDPTTAI